MQRQVRVSTGKRTTYISIILKHILSSEELHPTCGTSTSLSVCHTRCELEPTSAEVGEAFYGQEKKMHLILRNTGLVTANFQFMPLPGAMFGDDKDKNFRTAPRWATIEPEQVRGLDKG